MGNLFVLANLNYFIIYVKETSSKQAICLLNHLNVLMSWGKGNCKRCNVEIRVVDEGAGKAGRAGRFGKVFFVWMKGVSRRDRRGAGGAEVRCA